jgi:uncharacterized protein (TIRG00374 family)
MWDRIHGSRLIRHIATVALVVLAAYVLAQIIQPAELIAMAASADIRLFAVAVLSYYLTVPLRVYRWRLLLNPLDVSLSNRVGSLLILLSLYFNTILPAKAGDLYKCQLLASRGGHSRAAIIGTTAAERIGDLLVLTAGILGSIFFLVTDTAQPVEQVMFMAVATLLILGLGVVAVVRFPTRYVPSRFQAIVEQFRIGFRTVVTENLLLPFLVLTMLLWSANVIRVGLIVLALNIQIGLSGIVFTALVMSFLTGLPYTPAGIGVVELVGTVALLTLGVPNSQSVSLVLFDRVITVGSVLLVGTGLYLYLKFRHPQHLTGDPLL